QEVLTEVARRGGIAMPCHPGRPTIGLIEHYQKRPPLEGVVGVEALNGGSKKGENERVAGLIQAYGYQAFGGSDSHLVSFVGICGASARSASMAVVVWNSTRPCGRAMC